MNTDFTKVLQDGLNESCNFNFNKMKRSIIDYGKECYSDGFKAGVRAALERQSEKSNMSDRDELYSIYQENKLRPKDAWDFMYNNEIFNKDTGKLSIDDVSVCMRVARQTYTTTNICILGAYLAYKGYSVCITTFSRAATNEMIDKITKLTVNLESVEFNKNHTCEYKSGGTVDIIDDTSYLESIRGCRFDVMLFDTAIHIPQNDFNMSISAIKPMFVLFASVPSITVDYSKQYVNDIMQSLENKGLSGYKQYHHKIQNKRLIDDELFKKLVPKNVFRIEAMAEY